MRVLHTSTECYPAAKTGGLGDVVGSLPKYLPGWGVQADVVIPRYDVPWITAQDWKEVFRGKARLGIFEIPFAVLQLQGNVLPFPLYTVDIPGKFDRPGIYTDPSGNYYWDEQERNICFQQAILQWCRVYPPDILHCHDHHTGLIPFIANYCPEYGSLYGIPTVFTIHNGRYHGAFGWDRLYAIPFFNGYWGGLLEWEGIINPLAAGIKCSKKVTTVSNAYLNELRGFANGLESLFRAEHAKSVGILNGIDTEVWDPKTDELLYQKLRSSIDHYRARNKSVICERFGLERSLPMISFIGRLVLEKGADVLPHVAYQALNRNFPITMVILGSGDPHLQDELNNLKMMFPGHLNVYIGYHEGLAHQLYAGSDYILMPSRVEPCGLNQMYAMRYGSIPIVRRTGGLIDSVVDIGDEGGRGIMFNHVTVPDILHALDRARSFYDEHESFKKIRGNIMELDFSWTNAVKSYVSLYHEITQ